MTSPLLEQPPTSVFPDADGAAVREAWAWLVPGNGIGVTAWPRREPMSPGPRQADRITLLIYARRDSIVTWMVLVQLAHLVSVAAPALATLPAGAARWKLLGVQAARPVPAYVDVVIDSVLAGVAPPPLPHGMAARERSGLILHLWDLLDVLRNAAREG